MTSSWRKRARSARSAGTRSGTKTVHPLLAKRKALMEPFWLDEWCAALGLRWRAGAAGGVAVQR